MYIGHRSVGCVEPKAQKLMVGDFFQLDRSPLKRETLKVFQTLMREKILIAQYQPIVYISTDKKLRSFGVEKLS